MDVESVLEVAESSTQPELKIPAFDGPRIVIIGGGFAGVELVSKLSHLPVQVVLLDKHNFHTFQPLLYQVATAGLGPGDISSPLREFLRDKNRNFHFRLAEVHELLPNENVLKTSLGDLSYDHLIIATGAKPNYFGNESLANNTYSLKSIPEALDLRNMMIENFEKALLIEDPKEREAYLNVVIVGGGPTGVELAGAIEELRKNVLPKDYPELDFSRMKISLVEGQSRLLNGMSDYSGEHAKKYLKSMGIQVLLDRYLNEYDGNRVVLSSGETIDSKCVIWAAGVKGNPINGLAEDQLERDRILVDQYNRVLNLQNVYAVGDVALMKSEEFPTGLPMLAPAAIQQANNLSKNMRAALLRSKSNWKPFKYVDKGTMATIGRNKAVVDMPFGFSFGGFFGWFTWMFVHLISIIGFRRKLLVFSNWLWNYFTYNRGNRFIIKKNY